MSLPISTPPNAIAYSTGLIQQTDMVKAGLTVGILSMIVGYAVLIGVAVSASCAMSLPISTPPNAIAYSTGLIQQTDMVKAGLTVGILSMIVGYAVLITFCKMGVL
jgi:di/tricarboxylate transporter